MSNAVGLPPATTASGALAADAVRGPGASSPALNLSPVAYRLLVAMTVAVYLVLWLTRFEYVYGLVIDDYYSFSKGLATVRDWRAGFAGPSIEQAYFFLISYLPLWSGLALPSYPLYPVLEQTGQFRFLMLWVLFLHAVILLLWAWFLRVVAVNRLAALLAVILLATSPSFLLWSTKPDSRLLGLPFVFVGLAMLLRLVSERTPSGLGGVGLAFAAGTLLWVAQSIHYTALYLIVPAVMVVWISCGQHAWRQTRYWLGLGAFVAGCVWLQGLTELVDHFALGLPWDQGPTATLFALRTQHHSLWSAGENVVVWGELFLSQMGPLLLPFVGAGWLLLFWRDERLGPSTPLACRLLVLSAPLGLLYLLFAGSAPFFRQTSVLQPFLFLFAASGVVAAIGPLARRPEAWRGVALALVLAVAGALQWQQAAATVQAQLGLGHALAWVYANRGDRPLVWLPPHDFAAPEALARVDALAALPADAWLLAYFPWGYLGGYPALRPYLDAADPLGSWPTLYATDTLWAEAKGFGHPDLRRDPLLRDLRVFDAGRVLALGRGQPLAIRSVTADSSVPGAGPERVFDQGASTDQVTTWVSGDSSATHFLAVQFAGPVRLDTVQIVLPPSQRSITRLAALDIAVASDAEAYHTVWTGDNLERYPSITPVWPPETVSHLKLVVRRQLTPQRETRQAFVEELVFPGYHVVLSSVECPAPRHPEEPGVLAAIQCYSSEQSE